MVKNVWRQQCIHVSSIYVNLSIEPEIKHEGFGGELLVGGASVGGGPGVRAPWAPLNPALIL